MPRDCEQGCFGNLAPAVGFEPTTNRLTADRSTTELRWITQLKKTRVGIFAHDCSEATANPHPLAFYQ